MTRTLVRYFRQHPWQRRAFTVSLALIVGALTAILLYGPVRDWRLIRQLGSDDTAVRTRAILAARGLAAQSEATARRLEDALDTDRDVQFTSVVAVLRWLGRFDTPGRDVLQIDRMRAIELVAPPVQTDAQAAAETRWDILTRVILDGRDNKYVRRSLSAAAGDASPVVRELATMLAARLGDDATLRKLLADADPDVASAAALSAAAGRRSNLIEQISARLAKSDDIRIQSASAYALARLHHKESSSRICSLLEQTRNKALRNRLLHVMTVLNDGSARRAVLRILTQAKKTGNYPPPMALLAAGTMRWDTIPLDTVRWAVLDVLGNTRSGGNLTEAHLLAALETAGRLDIPVSAEINELCRRLWGPDLPLTMIASVDLLRRQCPAKTDSDNNRARLKIIKTLNLAANYTAKAPARPTDGGDDLITTPLPSAAAAVALWLLDQPGAEDLVRSASATDTTLSGDFIAWRAATEGDSARAFKLGLTMLPALKAPGERVYNDNERAAGAMLLAMSARTRSQKDQAVERITSRFEGDEFGGEDDFCTAGAFRCALLILGERNQLPSVQLLRGNRQFPQRRVLTALWAVGDRTALDWLLFNRDIPTEEVSFLLTTRTLGEVLANMAPSLPTVDAVGDDDLRHWQVRIMRHYWGVRRAKIHLGRLWR